MTSAFQDKSARVIFVDPSGPVRQMVSDVIRSLGFESVEGRGSIADLIEHLEIDEADWVIVPLMGEETVNAMHLLQVVTATPELKNTRVPPSNWSPGWAVDPSALTPHPRARSPADRMQQSCRPEP